MASVAAWWMVLLGGTGFASAHAAYAIQPQDLSPQPAEQEITADSDASMRMTVGVRIDGKGPFPFVVDTGAERTVISTELAGQLGLVPADAIQLLSLTEISTVPTVRIPRLSVSDAVISQIDAPAIARHHLGAAGILGIDTLQAQRVVFDFKRERMTVAPSSEREEKRFGDEIVVRAKSRFGRLVLADASADGQKIYVIIDSGAQVSVGNPALLKRLLPRRRKGMPDVVDLLSVTGTVTQARSATLRNARIGGIHMENIQVAITDSTVFHRLGLENKPALLLGMDVLRLFDRVSIDFANRKVRFLLPGEAGLGRDVRNAGVELERRATPAKGLSPDRTFPSG